jgi:RNA polymerase primary sigma factor
MAGLSKEDLLQEGMFGLMKAVDYFDPAMGFRFSTYAFGIIAQELARAITDNKHIVKIPSETMREDLQRSRKIREHAQEHGIEEADSAEQLGLSVSSALPREESIHQKLDSNSDDEL